MDRLTFAWAARPVRRPSSLGGSSLRRCHDELSVIADHVAATTGSIDSGASTGGTRFRRRRALD